MSVSRTLTGCRPIAPFLPPELTRLLNGAGPAERDAAWAAFVREYTPLLLRVTRRATRDEDGAMDAYAYVLEGLRADDFHRLGHFEAGGRGSFRTWLVVVARRLCHDFHRARYGQSRGEERSEGLRLRARLADLSGADVELDNLAHDRGGPEQQLRRRELRRSLEECIEALPPEDRLLLTWRFEDEVPVREIQQLTGAPSVFHVYRRLRSVLSSVKADLTTRGVDGPRP